MITIEPFHLRHLHQVRDLLNIHLNTLAPGWAVPGEFITSYLQRNPRQYVVDPWVVARSTLCSIERQRVVGAAHLLRYGTGQQVNTPYRGIGEIDWLVFYPEAEAAGAELLAAVQRQFTTWAVAEMWGPCGAPVGPFAGVPDVWPHIVAALTAAGYDYDHDMSFQEAVYSGRLDGIPAPGEPPLPSLTVRRTAGIFGAHFTALLDGQVIGECECEPDLTEGGALPALRGWAELSELEVAEAWRNRGIGMWLVRHVVAWLRLGGCDRIVLAVAAQDEVAGVGRFYQRCGWDALVREQKGWERRTIQPAAQIA